MYYVPQANATNDYPLDDEFFPRISLSEVNHATLRAEAASAVNKTLTKWRDHKQERGVHMIDCPPWKLLNEHRGLYQYKRLYKHHPSIAVSRVFGTIEGNYRDVARFFKTETREEYFNAQKILFPSTVDAAVLHTFPPREGEGSPLSYEGIKWAAYDPLLLRFRMDSCHYETMGEGVDADGKPYVYRVVLSINLREVPDLFKTKRTVRVGVRNIMIIQPSARDPNTSQVFACIQSDFKGQRIPRSLFKQYLVRLQSLGSALKARKTVYALKNGKWITPKTQGESCLVCLRPFSLLRPKAECSSCARLVCRKCLVKSSEVFGVIPSHNKTDRSSCKLCTTCVLHLRRCYEEELTTPVLGDKVLWSEDIETSIGSGRRNSHEEWTSSPVKATSKTWTKKKTRRRLETATSIEDELLSSQGSCASTASDLDDTQPPSPADDVEKLTYPICDDVIKEDDHERSSVELTIDTSEMARACGWRDPINFQPPSTVRGSVLFESINMSLHEQGVLLREMQRHASTTRKS